MRDCRMYLYKLKGDSGMVYQTVERDSTYVQSSPLSDSRRAIQIDYAQGFALKSRPWWLTRAISNAAGPGQHDECRWQRIADGPRGTGIQGREAARSDGTFDQGLERGACVLYGASQAR